MIQFSSAANPNSHHSESNLKPPAVPGQTQARLEPDSDDWMTRTVVGMARVSSGGVQQPSLQAPSLARVRVELEI